MKKVLTLSLAATLATSSMAFAHDRGPRFFERLDGDGDGRVTQQEMLAHKLQWFDAADTNKDGKLTPDERKAAFEAFEKEHPEMAKHHGRPGKHGPRGKRDEAEAAARHKHMNETWQRSEVASHVAKKFAELDTNGDGALTSDEMARGRHCHEGRRWEKGRGQGRSNADAGA